MQRSKTAPKGTAIFTADCLARDSYLLTNHNGLDTTAELLGVGDGQDVAKLIADLAANGDARAQVITLALVLGALESRTPKDAWRNATPSWAHHVGPADYLVWLRDHADYPMSAVEEIIAGTKDSEGVMNRLTTPAAAVRRVNKLRRMVGGTVVAASGRLWENCPQLWTTPLNYPLRVFVCWTAVPVSL